MELIVNGINLKDAYRDKHEFKDISARVQAHGSTCHADRQESGRYDEYYGTLWSDANALLYLLKRANDKIANLECGRETKPAKSDFSLSVTVELDGEKIARAVQAFNQEMAS